MGRKQKVLTSIAMAVEGVKLASELMDTIQGRIPAARKRAAKFAGDVRDSTADIASRLADTVGYRPKRGPSAGVRILQFAVGFGAGFGLALLFAPMPGSQVRENLYRMARGSAAQEPLSGTQSPVSTSSERSAQEQYGS